MNYIERVMGRINRLKGKLITEDDIKDCFGRDDVVIEQITNGFLQIYNAYSESEKGIIQFIIESVRLYEVYVLDYEEEEW